MNVMFIVQGEGRGHMTQALAMEQILTKAGHQVSAIVIGTCNRREVPAYFRQHCQAPVYPATSPNFYFDKKNKSIHLWKTVTFNLLTVPRFVIELTKIHRLVKKHRPEVIINFYDLLGGFYFGLFNPAVKRLSIAHQYLAQHPDFPFASGFPVQKRLFQLTNWSTSLNSHRRIALSFRDYQHNSGNLRVAPPLLRQEIFDLQPSRQSYLLAYVVNKGYADDLMEWHNRNKKVKIHCFWDNQEVKDEWSPWKGLTFHHINDKKFLELMSGCAGYVSTAGFESICEAMYLGKPIMMVPVENQYEQACNALDAVKAGAGIQMKKFSLGPFLTHLSKTEGNDVTFRQWTQMYSSILLKEVEDFVPNTRSRRLGIRFNLPRLALNNK